MMTSHVNNFSMSLAELLTGYVSDSGFEDIMINGLNLDSRKIGRGDMFIAIAGETVNGMTFINAAIENNAAAVVWDASTEADAIQVNWRKTGSGQDVPVIAIPDLKQNAGMLADRFYGKPSETISVCGITGTNGKTSCSHFIAQVMSSDAPCGLMGTLGSGIYPDLKETGYTTPDAISCHQWLADIRSHNAKYAVMEVSSHALIQGRVNGIRFENALFTNLSHEHLDFHGDMDSYSMAKAKLFHFPGLRNAIINIDDEAGRKISDTLPATVHCVRYGMNNKFKADVSGSDLKLSQDGLSMYVRTPWGEGRLTSSLIGRFNASNLLAVLSVSLLQGIEFDVALERLKHIESVPGRMQRLGGDNMPLIVVDYAHTPDALEQALSSLREHTEGNLWCVFGCGGDRDKRKRSQMGSIAENRADYIVLTNDNPRSEDPASIIEDIRKGISDSAQLKVESDRHNAIHYAIQQAHAGDVILIAGKGHENYQLIGNTKYPFNDVEEAMQQLEARAG